MHHDLIPSIKLPDDYKLGYKVCRIINSQPCSYLARLPSSKQFFILQTSILPRRIKYYYYKWVEPANIWSPLMCFDNFMDVRNFMVDVQDRYKYNIYIIPCVYIESDIDPKWWFDLYSMYGKIIPEGTQLAKEIMLVGDLIVP